MKQTLFGQGYLAAAVHLSTLLVAAMPVLGMRPMVVAVALWALLVTIRAVREPPVIDRRMIRDALLLSSPFLLMLLDLPRAGDLSAGWAVVEHSAALLVFPVAFLLLGAPSSEHTRHAAMDVLAFSALLLATWGNVRLMVQGLAPGVEATSEFSHGYRSSFAAYTGMQPTYAAYFFLAGALFQVHRALAEEVLARWRIVLASLLFIAALLIGSRMPLIAFGVATTWLLFMHLPRPAALRAFALIFVVIVASGWLAPSISDRMKQVFTATLQIPHDGAINSLNLRVAVGECTSELIREHWLWGVGLARVQPALDDCYTRFDPAVLRNGSYNTHSQPLHWWLAFGVIGIVLFTVYFGAGIVRAFRHRDPPFLAFLCFVLLCSCTENILARQWGVVFFAYFNALFWAGERAIIPSRAH